MIKYTIIEADLNSNKEGIIDLLLNNMRGQTRQTYEWNYEKNPFGNAHCWLARHEDSNSMVGSAAFFPRKVILKGKLVDTAITADFVVNEEHRVYGPALKLQREGHSRLKSNGFELFYGVPNDLSRLFFYRIGYKKLGKIGTFVKVIKTANLPRDYLLSSVRSSKYSRLMSYALSNRLFLKTIDFFIKRKSKERHYKKAQKYLVETPESFDDRFDLFWNRVKGQYNIVGERSSDFLNWRFAESPLQDYKIFCITDAKNNIMGYIVYYYNENRYYVVDMLFLDPNDILDFLIAEFALYARANKIGAIIVHYLGNNTFENKLTDFNFSSMTSDTREVLVHSPNSSLDPEVINKDNWHFFTGDIS
jgi:hypothetical protein